MTVLVEFPEAYMQKSLDLALRYKRSIIQARVGVGAREVQGKWAEIALHLKLVDHIIVICPKVMFEMWKRRYVETPANQYTLISSVRARMHGSFNGRDLSRTAFLIDIGVSGRHTAAVLNWELRDALWVCARQQQSVALTDSDPILVIPSQLGSKLVKSGLSVAET